MAFAVADRGVVDDGVEMSVSIDLLGDAFRAADGVQIADDDRIRFRRRPLRVVGPGAVARMQDDRVPLLGQEASRHQAKTIRGAGNEDARHRGLR